MTLSVWIVVARVVRAVVEASREAQKQVPDAGGSGLGIVERRRAFALALIIKAVQRLEQRVGRNIVNDAQFAESIDHLLRGVRLLAESIVRARTAPDTD